MFGEVDKESPFTRDEAELLELLELLTNPKIWWRRQTYVLMEDRDQIIMLSVFEILASAQFAWTTNWHFIINGACPIPNTWNYDRTCPFLIPLLH